MSAQFNDCTDLNKELASLRLRSTEESERLDEQHRADVEEMVAHRRRVMAQLRPATLADYSKWLGGHICVHGVERIHVYDSEFAAYKRDYYVALGPEFRIESLYGVFALKIIVPREVKVLGGDFDFGHCHLYYMQGYKTNSSCVRLFSDISF